MTTTPQTNSVKLPEENFGMITISNSLTFYMDRNPEVVNQVFNYLEEHFMKGIFNGGEDNIKLCKQVIKEENGGILYGWYTLHTKNTDRKIMIKTVGYGIKEHEMNLELYTKADYNNTCIMFPSDD